MWVQFQLGVKYPTLLGVIIPWLYRDTNNITATVPLSIVKTPAYGSNPAKNPNVLLVFFHFCWHVCPLNDGKNQPPRASISRQPEEFVRSTPQRPARSVANLPIKIGEFPGKEELINQNGD